LAEFKSTDWYLTLQSTRPSGDRARSLRIFPPDAQRYCRVRVQRNSYSAHRNTCCGVRDSAAAAYAAVTTIPLWCWPPRRSDDGRNLRRQQW